MRDSEREVARFYQEHPYLIAPEFEGCSCVAEQTKGSNRLDLLVRLANGSHSIVEFKREALGPADVAQLIRYWRQWKKSHRLAARHYLVGLRPRNPETLAAKVKKAPMRVIVRVMPDDIPTVVRWSEKTRRYVPYQEGDKEPPIELFVGR